MALNPHHFLLLLLLSILLQPPSTAADCPYPCYPSPTTGLPSTPPATQTTYNYYPPPASGYSPPAFGNLPYYPPPTWYGGAAGGGGYGGGIDYPPPPDPILPYFPYYFKNGLHKDQYSASMAAVQALPRSLMVQILLTITIFSVLCFQCLV